MLAFLENYLVYILAAVAVVAALRLFTLPVRWIFKLLLNTVLGFALLLLFNWLGGFIGLSLGLNWVNALVVGVLGLPGLVLLLLVRWLFLV